ncbi:semaphorin-1a [Tribolium castaneum]|uniref:Semaphorin-1A n=1 Tax=Tribolium castaneum TaxID=7070 RepID=D6W6W2_TRICA|nr:semaphorin-1a [Tribolium castaneum]EFA11605.1 semaphorin-1a-like protein [Tribolium castaneum]|eukprot:NP_001153720.1 semaphorin-1a [Tribolium castaneum]
MFGFQLILQCSYMVVKILVWSICLIALCHAWMPDSSSKLINHFKSVESKSFTGNATFPDHFIVLNQDETSILVGGRNRVYNLSIFDLSERKGGRIDWPSSDAHGQLCILKGKTDDDCQNYIRILYSSEPGKLVICGTNSYKPLCRTYAFKEGKYLVEKEVEGIGLCPYNPEHNSTSVSYNGQLFSATVADFSGGDPLIYREPQRTELSDLKQLNAPNFVNSVAYGDYIFFFYRETAVEYMNCGKVIYSRVARVCKDDKGGPHQSRDRWTSFLKARLNCSIPGEYPFYFDEIQSTSDIVEGRYNSDDSKKIIYGILTTPVNAIGGSAICAYQMADILRVFEGSFKHQETINSNWLPVPQNLVPEPRPGQCVRDSRILPDKNVNFIKTHSLMEDAVPALFGKPVLVRVSLQYRFTAITVDPQVKTINNQYLDVLYIGTDDGKVLKAVNIPNADTAKAIVISENTVLPHGAPVKQLKIAPGYGKVVVVGKDEIRLANLNHCASKTRCKDCVELQDPHCAWDAKQNLCVSIDTVTSYRFLIQDVVRGDDNKCWSPQTDKKTVIKNKPSEVENEITNSIDEKDLDSSDPLIKTGLDDDSDCDPVSENSIGGCAVRQQLVIYTAGTLHIVVVVVSIVGLFLGFIAGYLFSQKFHSHSQYPEAPFIEQHNHLERLSANQTGYLTPRANKAVNLVVNVSSSTPPPKKDNLDVSKDLNIASDGTLQKIKKTYI